MDNLGPALLDLLSLFLPPMVFALATVAMLAFLIVPLASILLRNPVMHLINRINWWLAMPLVIPCMVFRLLSMHLSRHAEAAIQKWPRWAVPERPHEGSGHPVTLGEWHGWELYLWLPATVLTATMLAAELAVAGLGATHVLGLPLAAVSRDPLLFGLTAEAMAFALAMVLSAVVFLAVIMDMRGASPGGARPWGNTSLEVRGWIERGCWAGGALSVIGIVSFSLYRSELVALDAAGAQTTSTALVTFLPYVFITAFALAVLGAIALVFWGVVVGIPACYILLVVGVARLFGALHLIAHVAHEEGADAWDATAVAAWDIICKPFHALWQNQLAGRRLLGRSLASAQPYCDRPSLKGRCGAISHTTDGAPAPSPRCYCVPRPKGPAETESSRAPALTANGHKDGQLDREARANVGQEQSVVYEIIAVSEHAADKEELEVTSAR